MKTTETIFNQIIESNLFYTNGLTIDLCDLLNRLVKSIQNEEETNWYLGECDICTLDSLIVGAYWALTEWHAGQWSEEYATLCKLGEIFKPNMSTLEEDSSEKIAYDAICEYFEEKKA
jgi:hypothetical protein